MAVSRMRRVNEVLREVIGEELKELSDPYLLRQALRGVDTVIHLAGSMRDQPPFSVEQLNGLATARLVDGALKDVPHGVVDAARAMGASTASVDAAQAQLVSARAQRDNVREQSRRVMELIDRGVYARARYDEAKASLDSAEAAVVKAQADLQRARQELGSAGSDNPQIKQALAVLEKARLDLVRTEITAPADGVITNLQLAVGQVVSAGQPALTFIDAGTIWVSAAFKENSLEYVRADNRAEVVFDLLPGQVFKARVESIGWGVAQEGNSASALPTIRNESGWVRDPQRFPVRLVVDRPYPLGPRYGSQVDVVIYTGDNPLMNALGALKARLLAILSYVN